MAQRCARWLDSLSFEAAFATDAHQGRCSHGYRTSSQGRVEPRNLHILFHTFLLKATIII